MTQDEYGTVLNSDDTYQYIAALIKGGVSVAIAWTEGEGSQLDIMFTSSIVCYGRFQRGIHPESDLMVSVMSYGAFGFEVNDNEKYPDYVGEKLQMTPESITTVKLAELINGVIKELRA